MTRARKFGPDKRTPQQLAQAILDHPFIPGSKHQKAENFGQFLTRWIKEDSAGEEEEMAPLLATLQHIAKGQPVEQQHRLVLGNVLQIIAPIREDLRSVIDEMKEPHEEEESLGDRKLLQEIAAITRHEQKHLGIIEKILTDLNRNLGIPTTPTRQKT